MYHSLSTPSYLDLPVKKSFLEVMTIELSEINKSNQLISWTPQSNTLSSTTLKHPPYNLIVFNYPIYVLKQS